MTAPDVPGAGSEGRDGLAAAIEFTREQTDRLGHWLSECLNDAAPLNERVWRSRAEWMVKGQTFQAVLREVLAARPPADEGQGTLGEALSVILRDHVQHGGASGGTWHADCLASDCDWTAHGDEGGLIATMDAHRAHVVELVLAARAAGHVAEVEQARRGGDQ